MKKILTIALAVGFGVAASAQSNEQIQNKKGVDIMPVSGEYAIGLGTNVGTLTGYVGNLFNNNTNNNIGNTYLSNPLFAPSISIYGKYMMSDNQAMRVSFFNSGGDFTNSYEVYDDRANDPDSLVTDKIRTNNSTTYVSAGLEWRRGKTRLRGVYGAEVMLSWVNSHSHYTYGNDLAFDNITPTDHAFMPVYNAQHGRTIEIRNGASFGVGARAFAGVEYFIAPKICIGTEFGFNLMFNKAGKSKRTYEKFDPFYDNGAGGIVTYKDETSLGGWNIQSGIDNFNSQLYFHFYF
jgi:hypothetical protein